MKEYPLLRNKLRIHWRWLRKQKHTEVYEFIKHFLQIPPHPKKDSSSK